MSLKHEVISRLLNSETAKEIADSSEAKYSTVLRWHRELKDAQETNTVAELIDMDKAVFEQVIQGIQAGAPAVLAEQVGESLQVIKSAKISAEALQEDLQMTASKLNMRIRNLSLSVENIGELDMLADALCKLQNAFFNKNATQVNVQNNYDSSKRGYATFLGDTPSPSTTGG